MAFNFPNSPALNDTYTQGGVTYRYDGEAWIRDNTVDIPSTTNDITEGSNLYYTDTRVDTRNEDTATYWVPATGAGAGGLVYDHSVDGNVSSITLPDFESGYEYFLWADSITMIDPANPIEQDSFWSIDSYDALAVAWNENHMLITATRDTPNTTYLYFFDPIRARKSHFIDYKSSDGTALGHSVTTNDASYTKIRISQIHSPVREISGGRFYFYKRKLG